MMKSKRIVSALILAMGLNLIGCGNETSVLNENGVIDNAEIVDDNTETTKESTEIEDGNVVTTDKPMSTETPKSTSTASPEPTAAPKPTATPEPTAPPHVHEWTETVTREASCSGEGEKKLVCECGESKVESIPATGEHYWEPVYQTVTHPGTGHMEEVQVQVGTSAGYTIYSCAVCGAQFDTPSGVVDHCAAFVPDPHGMANTIATDYPGQPIYETQSQWIVDSPEYTTQEIVGYKCSVCGATK